MQSVAVDIVNILNTHIIERQRSMLPPNAQAMIWKGNGRGQVVSVRVFSHNPRLPRVTSRHLDVSDITRLDNIVQGLHGLREWRVLI
jgi:hypothetical protein